MRKERVLITGCGGMLGEAIYDTFKRKYKSILATDIDINEPWLEYLDVRQLEQIENVFDAFKPQVVLHLAALTDLEYCEQNTDDSWSTNALGTENVGLIAIKYDATLVYISTAGIMDGLQEFYTDFDKPNPLSHYAKSKYYGEQYINSKVLRSYIFRAGWMMGGGIKKDKKFLNKIYKQIISGNKELFIVDDKLGTPTYTWDFAESISMVIETGYYGLYNQVCSGSCSRYEVAVEFLKLLGLSDIIKVNVAPSDYFKSEYYAPRPYSEKLINFKLDARNINFMRDWKICLEEYAELFRKDLSKLNFFDEKKNNEG